MFNVVVLDNNEEFLEFLDTDLLEMVETHEIGGLRTVSVDYTYKDLQRAKEIFKNGHKIWVQGHDQLTDCLYVINTDIQQNLAYDHSFSFNAEDVLVELNYAPLVYQNQLTSSNGFTVNNTSDAVEVRINWNALNNWFKYYYNIGIIQDCLGTNTNKVTFSGTMNLMSLLRLIEEETGNVFVTRYEKDVKTNVIHRYLDFLNPNNVNKNWEWNMEYDFIPDYDTTGVLDSNNNTTTDVLDDVDEVEDIVEFNNLPVFSNLDLDYTGIIVLSPTGETIIETDAASIGWTNSTDVVIKTRFDGEKVVMSVGEKSYVANNQYAGVNPDYYVLDDDWVTGNDSRFTTSLPNGSVFYLIDDGDIVFQHELNPILSSIHEDVLDLAYNVEDINVNVDESDTFSAISPILQLNNSSGGSNELNRTDLNEIIDAWLNLEVPAGTTIPMIIEKINVSAATLEDAKIALKGYVQNSGANKSNNPANWWCRPKHPQDNTDSDNKTFEFLRGTAYWKAPFTKLQGDMGITLDSDIPSDYAFIRGRPDTRDIRELSVYQPKMGNVETSEEDIYAIYNAVALKLKEKSNPKVEVDVDVSNLADGRYNDYNLYEKVFIKLPGTDHLIEARVDKTSKNAKLMNENTVGLSNYTLNTPVATKNTWIDSSNRNFKYPNSETLTAILVEDTTGNFLAEKLLTFTVYKVEDNSRTFKKVYTKKTNTYGQAVINMKYRPGEYEVEIHFGGDVEYTESSLTVEVSVGGTYEKNKNKNKNLNKNRVTSTVKRFWSKCGKSPDNKKVIGIGHYSASASEARKYKLNYRSTYKTIFKNYCPTCGKKGTLVFDGGSASKCINKKWHSRGYKIEWKYEHGITCYECDSDYDCATGLNTASSHPNKLTMLEKPVISGEAEFKKLIKGKLYYDTVESTSKGKNKTDSQTRNNVSSNIPAKVKKKTLSLVGNSKGVAAAKKIAKFCAGLKYLRYSNHKHPPSWVIEHGGNCCDKTRLMLVMMDAAGCREFLKLMYIHCHTGNKGHVYAQIVNRSSGKKVYVDPCCSHPWGNHLTSYGPIVGAKEYTGPSVIAY